jgi:basic amino acid/polyamine antiporter, APA family
MVIHLVAQGVLGPDLAQFQTAPLAEVANRIFGPGGRTLILVAAAVSMLGFMSGDLLSNPRVVYALAAHGMMPRVFAWVHSRYGTPAMAIVTYAVLACLLALFGWRVITRDDRGEHAEAEDCCRSDGHRSRTPDR